MTTIKKALAFGATVAATLIAIEVVAHVYYAVAQDRFHGAHRADAQAAMPSQQRARPADGNRRHPFEAITSSDPKAERNSYPPHPGGGETFVIGVFGGDAATDVAPALKQAVADEFALLGADIEPVVLDFAKDDGRQPQQLMAAIGRFIYGAQLDVLVNLDGLNEMNWRRDSTLDHHPRSSTSTMAELRLLSEIAALREREDLGGAVFGRLFNGGEPQRDVRQVEDELAAVSARHSLERHGPRREWNAAMQLAGAARQWFRSSALIAGLAEAMGADYYHLLQPGRHIAGGKERSTESRDRAPSERRAEDHPYVAMHPLLVELGRDLAARGIAFFDLANAFADEDEALYADACCRLTQRGGALLAASVLRHIAPSIVAASQGGKEHIDAGERRVVADRLLVAAHYDIFARGPRHLVYKRADCADADVQAPFFLDVFPLHSEDLDDEFANRGFEQAAFDFSGNLGIRANQRCVVEQRLPNYPIELLRTGQRDATTGEPRWLTWVQLDTAPVDRFKVFLRGIHGIVYKKPNCVAAEMQRQFFLHALPAPGMDGTELYPTTPDGYVNMDFEVALGDVAQRAGSCVFEHEVPFEFARLRTGQTKPGSFERLWRREIERP